MSGLTGTLAGILAGHHPAGLYTWQTDCEPADVRHTVEQAGWAFGHVDGWTGAPGIEPGAKPGTKRGFLRAVGVALGFPDHYGQNLDALADCLADLTVDTVLLWDGWSRLARDDEKAFRICLDVLRERTEQAGAAKFVVLLREEASEGLLGFIAVPPLE